MANSWKQNLIDLWGRLTAARAGYLDNLHGVVTAAVYSHPDSVAEQDALIFAAAQQEISLRLDFVNLAQNTTIREKEQIDAATYRQLSAKIWPTDFDAGTISIDIKFTQANALYKITLQSAVLEGGAKNIPYRYEVRSMA